MISKARWKQEDHFKLTKQNKTNLKKIKERGMKQDLYQ